MRHYRWTTAVMIGLWRPTRNEALRDALAAGQAELIGGDILLHGFARIEEGESVGSQIVVRK